MYIAWALTKNISTVKQDVVAPGDGSLESADESTPLISTDSRGKAEAPANAFDVVDIYTVDLYEDEHVEDPDDELDNEEAKRNLQGRFGWLWRLYYLIA